MPPYDMHHTTQENLLPPHGYCQGPTATDIDESGRTRSQAIAIKRCDSCDEEFASSASGASAEQMYDWATWRMYIRIVDHRRNQSLRLQTALPPPAIEQVNASAKARVGFATHVSTPKDSFSLDDYIYEGEVFEIDI